MKTKQEMNGRMPGPWSVHAIKGGSHIPDNQWLVAACGHSSTVDGDACVVAPITDYCRDAESDAKFIVLACNAHDELVAALEAMLEDEGLHSCGCKEYPPGFDDSHCCAVHGARAALAKAEPQ